MQLILFGSPYLRYGVACWGAAKHTALLKIKNLQNKIIRYITSISHGSNIHCAYRKLDVLIFDEIYFQEVVKFMHRNLNNTLPASFDEYFRPIGHQHDTRIKFTNEFSLLRPRTDLGKQSIKFNWIKIWSQVLCGIKQISNKDSFSYQIKQHLLNKSLETSYHKLLFTCWNQCK